MAVFVASKVRIGLNSNLVRQLNSTLCFWMTTTRLNAKDWVENWCVDAQSACWLLLRFNSLPVSSCFSCFKLWSRGTTLFCTFAWLLLNKLHHFFLFWHALLQILFLGLQFCSESFFSSTDLALGSLASGLAVEGWIGSDVIGATVGSNWKNWVG